MSYTMKKGRGNYPGGGNVRGEYVQGEKCPTHGAGSPALTWKKGRSLNEFVVDEICLSDYKNPVLYLVSWSSLAAIIDNQSNQSEED